MRDRLLKTRAALVAIGITLLVACGHTDPAIQTAVDSQLAADVATADLSVDIAVTRGVVRLEGEVQSPAQRRRALEIAQDVDGVKEVIDAMYVADAAIVAAVSRALASDPIVGRIPISVNVDHGNVQLISDQTGKEDRVRAVEIASRVEGVRQVADLMR